MRFPLPGRAAPGVRRRTLGQAMVEMALVAPLVIMLFVFAVDFGRAFFGWVGLQNAARIGANYASSHPDAWAAPNTPIKAGQRQELIDEITRDARSINCTLQSIPTPVFTGVGAAAAGDMGSHAAITLQCDFQLITRAFIGGNRWQPAASGCYRDLPGSQRRGGESANPGTNAGSHADADPRPDADAWPDTDANTDAGPDPDAYSDAGADPDADTLCASCCQLHV